MGNNLCCEEEEAKKQFEPTITVIHKEEPVIIPNLPKPVQDNLDEERPFENEISAKPDVKQYGDDVYEGRIDESGRPDGYGRMYYKDGSVFVGYFERGVAAGDGHYVRPDGTFYHGQMRKNKANDEKGRFWTREFEYNGSVVDNEFNGKGEEKGKSHRFVGQYRDNLKVEGKLVWQEDGQESTYEGSFNKDGKFDGRGVLTQPRYGVYQGDFKDGIKHGKGEYRFKSGLKYVGDYKNGIREGKGKIVNKKGTIAYDGEWKANMPHGKGWAPNSEGVFTERSWIEGLDEMLIH